LVFQEIFISFIHVDIGVRERLVLHCTANRVLFNVVQTRNVNTLYAQNTSFRCNDSSGWDLFVFIKHHWCTSPATPYCLEPIIKCSSENQFAV